MRGKAIPGLANWSHHVDRLQRGVRRKGLHRHEFVPSIVEGRPDQIVHRRIQHEEAPGQTVLDVEHARNQRAGVADDPAPRLEGQLDIEAVGHPLDHGGVILDRRQRLQAIADAQPAPEIEARQRKALLAQRAHQLGDAMEGEFKGRELGELRTDMHGDAHR